MIKVCTFLRSIYGPPVKVRANGKVINYFDNKVVVKKDSKEPTTSSFTLTLGLSSFTSIEANDNS